MGKDILYQIEFFEDGTFASSGDVTFEISASFLGNEFSIDQERNDWLGSGTWVRSENTLVTDTDGDNDVTTSEFVSESDTRIEFSAELVEDIEFQGIMTTNTCTVVYVLER